MLLYGYGFAQDEIIDIFEIIQNSIFEEKEIHRDLKKCSTFPKTDICLEENLSASN